MGLQLGNTGVMLAALRDVTPRHRVGTVTALFGASNPLGFAIGPVLGAFMVDGLGLPLDAVFWLGSALSLAAVVLLLVGSRDIRPAVIPEGSAVSLARSAISGVMADPAVRRIFAIFGVSILANQMSRPYLPLLVADVNAGQGNLASAIGLVAGTAALVGALLSPLAGPLGDRVGFRRVLAGALLGAGTMLLLMPLAPGVAALAGIAMVYAALPGVHAVDGLRPGRGGGGSGAPLCHAQPRAAAAVCRRHHRADARGRGGGRRGHHRAVHRGRRRLPVRRDRRGRVAPSGRAGPRPA